jgi:ABC-type uncharacterized transport system permease subunit
MLKLEARPQPSTAWTYGSPVLALAVTVLIGVLLFVALGKDPVAGLRVFFWDPIKSPYALGELTVKATPLLLIALGLAVCFRSNVWNIGAEGQYVLGAIAASGVALLADKGSSSWIVLPVILAGMLGGMFWAGITAWLRDRFNANEILVSLMLVYVAVMLLSFIVSGPWKDPQGYNFPQSRTFDAATRIPRLFSGSRINIGIFIALGLLIPHACWFCPAGRRPGAGGGPLRWVFVAPCAVGRAAGLGWHGGLGWRARGGRPHWPAHTLCAGRLRFCCHHRRLCWAATPLGHGAVCGADEHVLHRR